jgi:diacylglycerol kinase family enzyme
VRPTLIVNPFATRVHEARVRALEEQLGAVETLLTERKGHAIELAREAQGDAVFAYGGDGLLNEVLNGLPPGKPLGIVRGGSPSGASTAAASRSRPASASTRRPCASSRP